MSPLLRCLPLLVFPLIDDLRAATILVNGGFTGSLLSWTTAGTAFNTGDTAVFSDSSAPPVSIFQSGEVAAEVIAMELTFDFFNGLSTTLQAGFLPDAFFATLYLGAGPFGSTLAGGSYDEAFGLFDMDFNGTFNVLLGSTFSPSPKGPGWTRFSLFQEAFPDFSTPSHATVAFEFYNLNGVLSDSVVAVDNVSLVAVVPEPRVAALLVGSSALLGFRRRRQFSISS